MTTSLQNVAQPLRVLSLGAGVQSSTVAMMMKHGEIEPAEFAVFADTGAEPVAVYHYLNWLEANRGRPLVRTMQGEGLTRQIEDACAGKSRRASQPPMFTENGGKIMRKCTQDFKIAPIYRAIQARRNKRPVVQIFGISFDEMRRMRTPDRKYIVACEHPLVDKQMTRQDCMRWMVAHGYPIPPRSACVYCPFRCNVEWAKMRDLSPADFAEACRMDALMRDGLPGLKERAYVHRQLVPLAEADLRGDVERGQGLLGFGDCEGLCGV